MTIDARNGRVRAIQREISTTTVIEDTVVPG